MNPLFQDLPALLGSARAEDLPAARRAGVPLNFGDFRRRCAQWHAAARAHEGLSVGLYLEDTAEFAAALFGLWHAGKTVWLPGDATPATLQRLRPHIAAMADELVLGAELHDWRPLDTAAQQLVIYTSGSTAEPTAIVKRLGQLFSEVRALEQAFGARAGAAEVLATVSHQHIYGLLFRVLWPLAAGRVFHAERLAYVEDVQQQLQSLEAALLIASPAHLKRLPEIQLDRVQATRLCAAFSSGGPLPDEAVPDCLVRLGQAPVEVYGSSETGGVAWRQRSGGDLPWQALPGVQWRLNGEALEVRSPHLDSDHWAPSADRAAAAPEGGFLLLGRADRVLKIEEKRVSPASIEAALLATGWVHELRVLALPGAREQLAIVAVPTESGWALHDEIGKPAFGRRLRAALLQTLEPVSAPRRWRFVSSLPSNAQGKTTQAALQALFEARRPQPRLLHRSADMAVLHLVVDAAQPQFDGHFPGHPVLPGVAQVEWAILLGRELFPQLPPRFLGLEALKFQQVITPGLALTLSLEVNAVAGRLSFSYASQRGSHANGRVLFAAETTA